MFYTYPFNLSTFGWHRLSGRTQGSRAMSHEMSFCPSGHVPMQQAIERAARVWYSDQIAALERAIARELAETNAPSDKAHAQTPVEILAHALAPSFAASESLQRQFWQILTQTEHGLRNFLYQGALTAYYFGGLFDQGRHAVGREYWATPAADDVLISGTIMPFGTPRSVHESRPSYPLFLVETELNALLSGDRESHPSSMEWTQSGRKFEVEPAIDRQTEGRRTEYAPPVRSHPHAVAAAKRSKSAPALERARRALESLYPNGVPDAATVSNNRLYKQVSEMLSEGVSADTVLRAAGRRRK